MKKIHLLVAFITIAVTMAAQNVGIGTNTPTAQLHTTGSIRHAALNGVGIRPVFADSTGNLLVTMPPLPPSAVTNVTVQAIPDFNCSGVSSINSIAGLSAVPSASITVTIKITHPRLADLSIYLVTPGGAIINLLSPAAALAGSNLNNTIFTDGGALLSSAIAPFSGQFKPYADMATSICAITPTVATFGAIGGGTMNPNGAWTLRIIDNTASNTGTLNNWTISVTSQLGIDGLWGMKGNSGTNDNNFIGTTDDAPLRFRIRNVNSGRIDSASRNTGMGFRTLDSIFGGKYNSAFGHYALKNNKSGSYNIAIGTSALEKHNSGDNNTVVGAYGMYFLKSTGSDNSVFGAGGILNNTTGSNNTAIGSFALNGNTTGSYNTAIGYFAGTGNGNSNVAIGNSTGSGSGNSNVAVGTGALAENYYSSYIVAVGDSALFHNNPGNASPPFGTANTAIGSKTLYANIIGAGNTANGFQALYSNTNGFSNTAMGAYALYSNIDRSGLVAIGDSALFNNGIGASLLSQASQNTGIGSKALFKNTTGNSNTATGSLAMFSNIFGEGNTATGAQSLYFNASGHYNNALGNRALWGNVSGSRNIAIGHQSMELNNSGNENVAIGELALRSNVSGNGNIAIGNYTALNIQSGYSNVAIGTYSLYSNTNRSNMVAIGDSALHNNGTGATTPSEATGNTALGSKALYSNTKGAQNTATGFQALYKNTDGNYNTAVGYLSLYNNGTGAATSDDAARNTAIGYYSMYANTTGGYSTALGFAALQNNTTGYFNCAIGYSAMGVNINGFENTAVGLAAGSNSTANQFCTFLGNRTDASANLSNATAIGYNAIVNANNKIRLGNNAVTVVEGAASYTVSDGRFKQDVTQNVPGLDFISSLRPVTYRNKSFELDKFLLQNNQQTAAALKQSAYSQSERMVHMGFIAQEVEALIKEKNYTLDFVQAPTNKADNYSMAYGELIAPLVKAVQEQQQQISSLKKVNEAQKKINESLIARLAKIETQLTIKN